jgi:hypothetical protein
MKPSLAQPFPRDSQVASGGPYVPAGLSAANQGQGILDWINVQASPYNATGDGQLVTNAAMASGSTTLTSASGKFAAGDVGKTIIVYGAGASGGILATTITAYNSTGSVTLAAANVAGTNVSGLSAIWGTDDTAALQAAISAAEALAAGYEPQTLAAVVYLPFGIYVTQTLSVTSAFRLTGDGPGSLLVTGGSALIDFGNNYITGLEFDHFGADVTGGHIFTDVNLHRCSFHHLQLIQESYNFSIMSFGNSGSGLSNTEFHEIMFTGYGNPANNFNRTVSLWSLHNPGDKNIDVVTWRKCSFLWNPPSWVTAPDNSQWVWDVECTATDSGGYNDRLTFDQCDGGSCLGGLIRIVAAQGVLINQAGAGNIYTQDGKSVGHSMIYIGSGTNSNANARATTITGYTRETSGTISWGSFYDIEVDASTVTTTIITPCATGMGSPLRINLNGSNGVIINPDANVYYPAGGNGSGTVVIG